MVGQACWVLCMGLHAPRTLLSAAASQIMSDKG